MRHTVKTLIISLFFITFFVRADLQKGIDAANEGDFETALFHFNYLVQNNYGPAMYHLGQMYEFGYGIPRDPKKASEIYEKGAALGEEDAIFALGTLYQYGKGVDKDLQKAVSLYEQSAQKGLAAAQFNLGVMYANGTGVIQDFFQAKSWYTKAAAQNYAAAQFNLALLYFEGQGVDKNLEMSFIWNSVAEFNGHKDASHSRKLDERKMSPSQVKDAKEKANELYQKILAGKYYGDERRI
ncbi:tetratricopeptide repeat protein [Pseudoalteromonas sp.]|uniref:tetratricopeptide repeat protein n=1 Tax=Pseudoalteromonas sp. TaxID=53249 RepID=UPI00356AACEC